MTSDTAAVLIAVGVVVIIWRYSGGGSSSLSPPPPTDINTSAAGVPSDPTSSALNNQSGTFSSGVQ